MGACVTIMFVEPWRIDFIRDCIRDVLVEGWKHEGGHRGPLRFGELLPCHSDSATVGSYVYKLKSLMSLLAASTAQRL